MLVINGFYCIHTFASTAMRGLMGEASILKNPRRERSAPEMIGSEWVSPKEVSSSNLSEMSNHL